VLMREPRAGVSVCACVCCVSSVVRQTVCARVYVNACAPTRTFASWDFAERCLRYEEHIDRHSLAP